MNNFFKIAALMMVVALVFVAPALAQDGDAGDGVGEPNQIVTTPLISFSGAIGAAIVCIGSAFGIGKLASSAVESMARQPEVAGNIQTAMIIAAALIEGFTFFALIVCLTQG